MDFSYSEEQQMLADTVTRWLATDAGPAAERWARLADLGLPGLNIPEEYGGLGSTPDGGASRVGCFHHFRSIGRHVYSVKISLDRDPDSE